jgi:hypothetical protein
MPIVLKSGSLNLLENYGPVQASNRIALPFTFWLHNKVIHEEAFVHSVMCMLFRIYFFYPVLAPAHVAGLTSALKLCGLHSGNMQVISQTLTRIPYCWPYLWCFTRYAISGYTKSRTFSPIYHNKKAPGEMSWKRINYTLRWKNMRRSEKQNEVPMHIGIMKPTWCTFRSVYWESRDSTCFEHYLRILRRR